MSSQLPKAELNNYWQALSANPQVQSLEGQGTAPQFADVVTRQPLTQPKRGFDYNL
jgi:hypothetical protein